MSYSIIYLGLDVHKDSMTNAVLPEASVDTRNPVIIGKLTYLKSIPSAAARGIYLRAVPRLDGRSRVLGARCLSQAIVLSTADFHVRISAQAGHRFRRMSDTDFGASRTPVSLDVGHLSRGGALEG